jgi:hypothetical protein
MDKQKPFKQGADISSPCECNKQELLKSVKKGVHNKVPGKIQNKTATNL